MRRSGYAAIFLLIFGLRTSSAEVSLHWVASADGEGDVVEVRNLSRSDLAGLRTESDAELAERLKVFVEEASGPEGLPAMLGRCRIEDDRLVFQPRFPFAPGIAYRAEYRSSASEHSAVDFVFTITRNEDRLPTTSLDLIAPSANHIPQNLLKFYLHFSGPMEQGNCYRFIEIVDADGKRLAFPFLELPEELWDRTGRRLTLLLDPGRVKRGLVPREEDGPIFEVGAEYRLRILPEWKDAQGRKLLHAVEKRFTVVEPDFAQPDPNDWKIQPPALEAIGQDTRKFRSDNIRFSSLQVYFPESLDRALLSRCLEVEDANRQVIPGRVVIGNDERHWTFTPSTPWQMGKYFLKIDPVLEDLAGNSVGRAFEVATDQPSQKVTTDRLEFQVQ